MTLAERNAIPSPADGLLVYCTDCGTGGSGALSMYRAGTWYLLNTGAVPATPVAGVHVVSETQVVWKWGVVAGAAGYKWNTSNDFASGTDVGLNAKATESGIRPDSAYTRYVWAYNDFGISAVAVITAHTAPYYIGLGYGGGIIFYLDGTGHHGLIAAPADQSATAWGCSVTGIPGTSTAFGTGQANTAAIVNGCYTGGAARLCNDLLLNGYTDWFLPSRDELAEMFLHRDILGGFPSNYFWSSSQFDNDNAWGVVFSDGQQYHESKLQFQYVRAIRSF